jgi:mono/diheme cytochrome c family protein
LTAIKVTCGTLPENAMEFRGQGKANPTVSRRAPWLVPLTLLFVQPAAAIDPESAFRGKRLAEANCADCHAIAQVDESLDPSAPPFRSMGRRRDLAALRIEMTGDLFLRHAVMPDFEPDAKQADDIVTYMESIQD